MRGPGKYIYAYYNDCGGRRGILYYGCIDSYIGTYTTVGPDRCGTVFRMTPFEWELPHPVKPGDDTMENSMTLLNCLWFSIGSVLCAGCEVLPK